uniref:Uncharacterized protein n=1 Tax=Trichuris muris TaxID=70415 RepID=A0A5S6QC29_TRIMR
MDELSVEENELINVYKTLLLTVKQVIRPEHKELLNNVPLAIIKCVTTMEFSLVKSPEMLNMAKRLTEVLPKMEYAYVLKQLKIYVDELKRRRDVVVSCGDAGTVEWIKLKNRSIVGTKQLKGMKSRDEMAAALIKATRLLHKEMTKPVEWNRSDCRTIEKLERKIEILRDRQAAREGVSTSTGCYSMETPPEFASCGFAQIDNAETVVRATQEHCLGLSNQMIDDIAAKLAVDIGVAIKKKKGSILNCTFKIRRHATVHPKLFLMMILQVWILLVRTRMSRQPTILPKRRDHYMPKLKKHVTEGKSDSQEEISKLLNTMNVNVPKRRIVLSDPFIPETYVSAVKKSDEQQLGKRKKRRKQNRQKVRGSTR